MLQRVRTRYPVHALDLLPSFRTKLSMISDEVDRSLSAAFRECCFTPGKGWRQIELLGCEQISDEAMRYAMSTHLKRSGTRTISVCGRAGSRGDALRVAGQANWPGWQPREESCCSMFEVGETLNGN